MKTLILDRSYFVPTTIKMPPSSIASLLLSGGTSCGQRAYIDHVLGLLRNTLETFEFRYILHNLSLILETVQLPRLTGSTQSNVNISTFMKFTSCTSSTITKLCITPSSPPQPLHLFHSVFPWLRELFSNRGGLASNLSLGDLSKSSTIQKWRS